MFSTFCFTAFSMKITLLKRFTFMHVLQLYKTVNKPSTKYFVLTTNQIDDS